MLPREHYLKQSFVDSVHFPDGFEKGGLSDIQARLVRKNGTLINALCIDEVSDPTPEDLHILKVVANQSSPKNPVEQAWVKYLSLVKNLAASAPKGKSKAKPTKPVSEEPEVVTPTPKTEKPVKATEKTSTAGKSTPQEPEKKIAAPTAETKLKPAAKKEKVEPETVTPKATAKPAEKKAEAPKKTVKAENEPEVKKAAPKKTEAKKPETKAEAKTSAAKKTGKSK